MVTVMTGTKGAIAYIAVSYLIGHQLPAAAIQNAAGSYEVPNLKNIANAAGERCISVPGDKRCTSSTRRGARIAYPISTFTYAILQPSDPLGNGAVLKSFVAYCLKGGQAFSERLDFAPIPRVVRNAGLAALGRSPH